jgi:hypothetical protein
MDGGVRARLGLVGLVAALGLAAGAVLVVLADAARSGTPDELEPDLFVQRPAELYLADGRKEIRLRVSNTVANRGAGPLEIKGGGPAEDCNVPGKPQGRFTLQNIYRDSDHAGSVGHFERDHDLAAPNQYPAGCSRYHPEHDHWHFDNFARYTLLNERTGERVAGSRKVSFCVIDTGRPYPGLPGSPTESYYPQDPENPKFPSCSETSVDGLSIGWEDTYGASLPGQGMAVTDLERGPYCLVLEADPPTPGDAGGVLEESNESNNARTIRIRINPPKLFVTRVDPSCRSA